MATKHYIGKELKPPYDGPQQTLILNPKKSPPADLSEHELRRVKSLLTRCTKLSTLEKLGRLLDAQIQKAEVNDCLPDEIPEIHWQGTLAREKIKCGKKGCHCEDEASHGPYWYAYLR